MEKYRKQPTPLKDKEPRSGLLWTVLYLILVVIVAILAGRLYVVNSYLIVPVDGSSMEQTVHDGDTVYATRNTDGVRRGDIVVVEVSNVSHFSRLPTDRYGRSYIIKRLIAVGGDRVKCENGVVYLDRGEGYQEVEEGYLAEGTVTEDFEEVVLGEGEIFVMGDHREKSDDSRELHRVGAKNLQKTMLTGVVLGWSLPGSAQNGGIEQFFVEGFLNGFLR